MKVFGSVSKQRWHPWLFLTSFVQSLQHGFRRKLWEASYPCPLPRLLLYAYPPTQMAAMASEWLTHVLISSSTRQLRFWKTATTWLWSLSAILPLFWRHDIAELRRLYREDLRNVLWHHEIYAVVYPRNMTYALQNMQLLQYFIMQFNIFFLYSTGESDFFFILFISTHNKLSMSGFNKVWMIRCFAVVNYMVRKFSFCSNLYADVIANMIC